MALCPVDPYRQVRVPVKQRRRRGPNATVESNKGHLSPTNQVTVDMPAGLGRLLTTEQAAEVLAVSVRTVKNLMSGGQLAYVKIGRATRIDREDINLYVTRNGRKQRQSLRRVN